MKVVIAISHSFCANFIKGQAEFLRANHCEVIIVSAPGPEVSQIAKEENARLVEIPFNREISIIDDLKSLFYVIKFLNKEKPDIVNAGNPKTGFLFMLAKLIFSSIPMVFTLRGLRSDTLTGIKRRVVTLTERLSCRLADKVIVISPSLKEHAISRGILDERKSIVIGKGSSNGVNTQKFTLSSTNIDGGKTLRLQLKLADSAFVIAHVGRITKDKGVEDLYKAFKICKSFNADIKLILAGPIENDDPIDIDLMNEIKNDTDVILLGKVNNVTKVYAACNLLVLYSYREGFGNVALEASCMEVPVIVSNIPGARDTTEHLKSGLIVETKKPDELSKAILFYISNPNIAKEHGAYGAKRAREFFSSNVIWNGQIELYRDLSKKFNEDIINR